MYVSDCSERILIPRGEEIECATGLHLISILRRLNRGWKRIREPDPYKGNWPAVKPRYVISNKVYTKFLFWFQFF